MADLPQRGEQKSMPWFNDEMIVVNGQRLSYDHRTNDETGKYELRVHFAEGKTAFLRDLITEGHRIVIPQRIRKNNESYA